MGLRPLEPMTETAVRKIEFLVNGDRVRVDEGAPGMLLDFLRARGLTGAKEGCAEGECGACAVALVAPSGSGSAYRVVNSCLLPVALAAGREVITVEGLASNGTLAPVQQAIAEAGGSQCGYCTPGFVVSLFAEQYRPDRTGACDPLALAGNLCRCTGYRPIADAARSIGPAPDDTFKRRLASPAPMLATHQTHGFSRPASVDACIALLAANEGAAIGAGGTDAGVDANLKHRRWPLLVSVEAIDELREFSIGERSVRIGAAVPLSDIGTRWR